MTIPKMTRSTLLKTIPVVLLLEAIGITGYFLATKRDGKNKVTFANIRKKTEKSAQICENLEKNRASLKREIQQLKSHNSCLNKHLGATFRFASNNNSVEYFNRLLTVFLKGKLL